MSPNEGVNDTTSLNTSVHTTSSGKLSNGPGFSPHEPRDGLSRSSSYGNLGEDDRTACKDNISSSGGAEDNSRGEEGLGTVAGKHIEVPRCASIGQEEQGDSSGRGGGGSEDVGELEPWKSPRPIRSPPREQDVDVLGRVDLGTGDEDYTAREESGGEEEPERYDTGSDSNNDSDGDSLDGRSWRRRERRRRRGRFADDFSAGHASQRGGKGRDRISGGNSSRESGMGEGASGRDAAGREGSALSRTEEVVELWRPGGSQGTIRGDNIAGFSDTVGGDRLGQKAEGAIKAPPGKATRNQQGTSGEGEIEDGEIVVEGQGTIRGDNIAGFSDAVGGDRLGQEAKGAIKAPSGKAARNQQGTSGEGEIEDGEIVVEGEHSCSVTASVVHDSRGNRSREQLSLERSRDVAPGRDRLAARKRRKKKARVRASKKSMPWSTDPSSAQHSRSSAARHRDDSWSHTSSPRSTGRSRHRPAQDRSAALARETSRDRYADRYPHRSGNDYRRDRPVSRGPRDFRRSPPKRATCRSEMRSVGDRSGANQRRDESRGRDRERSLERSWRRSSPTYPAARGTRDNGRDRPSTRSREALRDQGRPNEGETDLSRGRSERSFSADRHVVGGRRSFTNGDVICRDPDSSCRDTEGVRRQKREREREPERIEESASRSSHREREGVPDRECYHGRERAGALTPSSDSEGTRCKGARASADSDDTYAIGGGGRGIGAGSRLTDGGIGGDVGDGDVSGSRTESRRETSVGEKGGALIQLRTATRREESQMTGRRREVSFSSSASSSLSTLSKENDSFKCGGSNRSEDGLPTTAVERKAAETSAKAQARGDESCASSDHCPSGSAGSAGSSRSAFSVGSLDSARSADPAGSPRFLGSESERGRRPQSNIRCLDYCPRDRTACSAGLRGREAGYDHRRRSDNEGRDLRLRAGYGGDNLRSSSGNERDLRLSYGSVGGNLEGSEGGCGSRRNGYGSGSPSERDEGLPPRGDSNLVDPLGRPPDSAAAKLRKDARSSGGVDTRPEGIVGGGSASVDASTSKAFPHPRGLKTSELDAKAEAKPKAGSEEDAAAGAAADLRAATVAEDESQENQQLPRNLLGQKPDFESAGGGGAEGLKFVSDREEDARRISQRQKQIDFGKNTGGYDEYIRVIPVHKRRKTDPVTPDKNEKMSKRQWAGRVRSWRRRLHAFDKNAPPLDGSSAGLSDSDSGDPKESVESGKSDDSGAGSSFGRGRGSGESDGSAEVPGGGPAASSTLMTQQQRNEGTHGDVRDSKAKDDRQDEKQRQQREEMNAAIYGDLLEAGDEDDVFGSRSDFGSLFAGKGRGSDGGKWKRRVASSECSTSDGEADYDDAMGNVDMKEDEGSDRRRPRKRPRRAGAWKGWGQAYGEGSTLRLTKGELLEADEALSREKNPPDGRESKSPGTTGLEPDDVKESRNVVVGSLPVGADAWPGGLRSPRGGQCSPRHPQPQQPRGGDECEIEDRQVAPFLGGGSTAWGRGDKENVSQLRKENAHGESGAFAVAKGGIGDEAGGHGNAGAITCEPAALTGLQRMEEEGEDEMFSDDDLL